MAIFGKYFTYNGYSSEDYGLTIASFEEIDEYQSGMERDLQRGEMNRYRFKPNHFGMTYSDTLQFVITMVKDPCINVQPYFTRTEYRRIAAWLTSTEYPTLFHMTDEEDDVNGEIIADEYEDYFGVFSNVENHAAGNIIGITATFTCDSPFSYSKEITSTFTTSVDNKIRIDTDTDYVYPVVAITFDDTGTVTILNKTDNNNSCIMSAPSSKKIIMDCQKLTLQDGSGNHLTLNDVGITDPNDIYWIRFLNGINEVTIAGNATVEFKYRTCRKVGAY